MVDDNLGDRRCIAIIGAGYAGLTLINLLSNKNTSETKVHDSVMIFDALHPPSTFVEGDLCVPIAKELYRILGWNWPTFGKSGISDSESLIREEILQKDLRRKPNVQYYHFCFKIEGAGPAGNYLSLHFRNRSNGCFFCHPKLFDVVVLCHGVRSSSLLQNIPSKLDKKILIVGDARFYRIWDFGYLRLKQGANQAMKDAIDVSILLRSNGSGDWGKYGLKFKRQDASQSYICLICVVCSLIVISKLFTIKDCSQGP
jgi:hypothetical protein